MKSFIIYFPFLRNGLLCSPGYLPTHVAEDGLELLVILLPPSESWNYKYVSRIKARVEYMLVKHSTILAISPTLNIFFLKDRFPPEKLIVINIIINIKNIKMSPKFFSFFITK